MRRRVEPAPAISLAGSPVRSETLVVGVGAYHLVLTTVLPGLGVEVESFYTGHEHLAESRVTHLLLAPGERELEEHRLVFSEIPVVWARRRCLYDHLQRLQEFGMQIDLGVLQIDVGEEAFLATEA